MCRIALFAGTAEGRETAEYIQWCAAQKTCRSGGRKAVKLLVYTATEYGAMLLEDIESSEGNTDLQTVVKSGRLGRDEMASELLSEDIDLVIDATHPYAVAVTQNINAAVEQVKKGGRQISLLRVMRDDTAAETAGSRDDNGTACEERAAVLYFDTLHEAVSYLKCHEGFVLSSVGSKELSEFTALDGFKERVFARILPDADNLRKALEIGFSPEKLICMQGPFSTEMNRLLFREKRIDILVTKDSGAKGGFPEKLEAAGLEGVTCLVIRRPPDSSASGLKLSLREARGWLERYLGIDEIIKRTGFVPQKPGQETPGGGVWIEESVNRAGLRRGLTTGTCAALAARAGAYMAVRQVRTEYESLITPSGLKVGAQIESISISDRCAVCAVRKFAGDDPDVTDGLLIFAEVRLLLSGPAGPDELPQSNGNSEKADASQEALGRGRIELRGGEGIGIVTRPGLKVEPGKKAINPVPEHMILTGVSEVFEELGYSGGAVVTISVPGGEEAAQKTFNPQLGIEGGISIIGTTGIVEPMSHEAFMDTVSLQMDMILAAGSSLLCLTPGSIGEKLLSGLPCSHSGAFGVPEEEGNEKTQAVLCGNYFGEALDMAADKGFERILIAGHMGKLVKLSAGIMNTHSHEADGRMEVIASHLAMAGGLPEQAKAVMNCVSTDAAYEILAGSGLAHRVTASILEGIVRHVKLRLKRRGADKADVSVIMFCGRENTPFFSGFAREEFLRR